MHIIVSTQTYHPLIWEMGREKNASLPLLLSLLQPHPDISQIQTGRTSCSLTLLPTSVPKGDEKACQHTYSKWIAYEISTKVV
jgi:hypothetical protein